MDRFSGERVLVTGAYGFIGSHLCSGLHAAGADVHAISRGGSGTNGIDGVHWTQGDVSDWQTTRNLLSAIRPDLIFHLASYVSGARTLDAILPTFTNNLASTVNLLTAATEMGCRRIVLAGSLEEPEPGDDESIPSSPYAAAKWAASGYARMFHALFSCPVVLARIFMVYGPGQRDVTKLVPYTILSSLQNQPLRFSSGVREVDWIYVEDVVGGLLAAAQAPGVEGRTIELGSGQLTSIRSIVEQLVALVDAQATPVFGALPDRPMEQVRVANVERTNQLTGWHPAVDLGEGLQRTVDWYKQHLEQLPGRPSS